MANLSYLLLFVVDAICESSPLAQGLPLLGAFWQDVEEWVAARCAAQVYGWLAAGRCRRAGRRAAAGGTLAPAAPGPRGTSGAGWPGSWWMRACRT